MKEKMIMLKALTMYLIPSCFFVSLLGCSENSTPPVTLTKHDIQHVIVLMLENRSYDELLAGYQVSAPQQFQTAKYAIHKNGDRFTADGIVLNNTYLKQPYYLESMNTNKNNISQEETRRENGEQRRYVSYGETRRDE